MRWVFFPQQEYEYILLNYVLLKTEQKAKSAKLKQSRTYNWSFVRTIP